MEIKCAECGCVQILIVSTKPATTVTRMFVAVFTIPTHAAMKIFEYWSQGVSKNKKGIPTRIRLIVINCEYLCILKWQAATKLNVINVEKL
jgi:hypothetical protein